MTDQTTPRPGEEEDDYLAAEFALGLAEGENLTIATERARRDTDFARRVADWQERFVAMTDGIAPVAPRDRVKRKMLAQVFPKKHVPILERVGVWKALTLAALVALAYFALPNLRPPAPDAPADLFAAQMRGETGDLELIAVVDPAAGDIALRRLAGGAPADRVLELWAILPEQAPISLGVLPETEVARVNLPADLADRTPLMTLAITDEPPGGAPEGSPTGEIRAVGAVNEL